MAQLPCYDVRMINTNTEKVAWPEAGRVAAVVVPDGDSISQAVDRVIEELVLGQGKRVGFIQKRLGGEELVKRVISVSEQASAERSERGPFESNGFVAMTDSSGAAGEPQIISLRLPAGKEKRLSEVAEELRREKAVDDIVIVETLDSAGSLDAELPLLGNLARSSDVGISLIFSEDGNGLGTFSAELASQFDRVSE